MSRPMVINDATQAAIATAVRYAEANVLTLGDCLRIRSGARPALGSPGIDEPRRVVIPFGFVAVISLEEQEPGLIRHLSISIRPRREGRVPNPCAIEMLLPLLGFKKRLEDSDHVQVDHGLDIVHVMQLEGP